MHFILTGPDHARLRLARRAAGERRFLVAGQALRPDEPAPGLAAMARTARVLQIGFGLAALCVLLSAVLYQPAHAEDLQPGAIHAVDVMGDKGRSALDGFSQAPVPREESAGMDEENPGGHSIADDQERRVPVARMPTDPALEPQAPIPAILPGPATTNPSGP